MRDRAFATKNGLDVPSVFADMKPASFKIGQRVRIIDGDCEAKIADITYYLDGTHRYGVEYWHNGERKSIGCRPDELEAIE